MSTAVRTTIRRRKGAPRDSYHHGDLRNALVAATVDLLEEGGPEAVSVREVAKRAGVSPGAPFRHFPTRMALMTAVAEEATRRLRAEIAGALAAVGPADPLTRLRAFGAAYFRWVTRNTTMFLVVSTRSLIDYDASPTLGPDNDAIRAEIDALISEAEAKGLLRKMLHGTPIKFAARALVYGLARMLVDGHMRQWKKRSETPESAMNDALDLFINMLRA